MTVTESEAEQNDMGLISSLPKDLALIKMENDTIQAMAKAAPRNHPAIKKELQEMIQAYPAFAAAVVYAKPVGKDENGRQKIAKGLSIRAAEALSEIYGLCRVRTFVNEVAGNPDVVQVGASFTDFQKGRVWEDSGLLSKWYRGKDGKMRQWPDDRFYNVTVKAEVSKRAREVIVRSVSYGLRAELQEMAERASKKLLDAAGIKKIVDRFASQYGVDLQRLETFVGRTVAVGWTEDDRLNLLATYNAIEGGEVTVQEMFDLEPKQPATPVVGAGAVSASDLMGAKATQEPPKPAAPPPAAPAPAAPELAGPQPDGGYVPTGPSDDDGIEHSGGFASGPGSADLRLSYDQELTKFEACKTIGEANLIESNALAVAQSDTERSFASELAERVRERVRGSRGGKAKAAEAPAAPSPFDDIKTLTQAEAQYNTLSLKCASDAELEKLAAQLQSCRDRIRRDKALEATA